MTDITQLAKSAGAKLVRLFDKDAPVYEFTKPQLAKLEQLLRDKFIAELGEPAGEVEIIKFSNGSEITYLSLNNDAKVNNGDLLYTLQGFIK